MERRMRWVAGTNDNKEVGSNGEDKENESR